MKGKFAGRAMHIEYHTVNPKKRKAADCIYLTTDRVCQNKKSPCYLAKCFQASFCPLKVKEQDAAIPTKKEIITPTSTVKATRIKSIDCTLPYNCDIRSKAFGNGKFIRYDESSMTIYVQFSGSVKSFKYPQAILDKYLTLSEHDFKQVLYDISKAKKG